ncbi:hypothetical protein BpHYR1_046476 [Brachionus plicatilis]|uniref:Uncharacterized protein n=1 Tax=Brachionus plicatilis TaxID=10195 RepID=A0A3M7PMB4_BRAPC|nr:hypothetical protein BpHYR1_046476 [Brachionus plicatilis]
MDLFGYSIYRIIFVTKRGKCTEGKLLNGENAKVGKMLNGENAKVGKIMSSINQFYRMKQPLKETQLATQGPHLTPHWHSIAEEEENLDQKINK